MWEVYATPYLWQKKYRLPSCIFKVQNKKNSIELENCPPLSFIASILYSKGLLAIFLMNSWMQQPIYQYEYFLHRLTESCNVAQIQSKHQTLTVMSFYVSRASKWVWQFSIRVKNVLQLENETLCLSLNSPFLFLFAISISLQKLLASFYDKCDKVIWLLPWKAMAFSAILKIIASGNSILEISKKDSKNYGVKSKFPCWTKSKVSVVKIQCTCTFELQSPTYQRHFGLLQKVAFFVLF